MNTTTQEDIDFGKMPSVELLEYISYKNEFPAEAQRAFVQFCYRFEKDLKRKSEIYCNKYGYSEVVALEITNCTFLGYGNTQPLKRKSQRPKIWTRAYSYG